MPKLASQADLWYNRDLNMVDRDDTDNISRSEYNLFTRSHYGYSILIPSALQALLCFPLDKWRKVIMAPRKDTPEYDAWKNSPEYETRSKKIALAKKGKLFSAEAKANMSAAQKESYANLTDEEKAERRATNNLVTGKGEIWRGRKHTEETKAKLAITNKGKEPPNKGKPMAYDQKQKLSDIAKMRDPMSEETRSKLSAAGKGRKYPPEYGEAISERLKGHSVSEEARAKSSKALKGRRSTFLGRKHSQESKDKMALATSKKQKARYAAMSQEELDALTEKRMSSIHLKNTSIEVFVASQLDILGTPYRSQERIGRWIIDFFFPEQNIALEVNGCYWHCCEQCGYGNANIKKQLRDEKKLAFLEQMGYAVIILWEHDIRPLMPAIKRIRKL